MATDPLSLLQSVLLLILCKPHEAFQSSLLFLILLSPLFESLHMFFDGHHSRLKLEGFIVGLLPLCAVLPLEMPSRRLLMRWRFAVGMSSPRGRRGFFTGQQLFHKVPLTLLS
ncbi:hypothetical protein BKA81DRAFT_358018 [Phyllosticta paracitricarpa]